MTDTPFDQLDKEYSPNDLEIKRFLRDIKFPDRRGSAFLLFKTFRDDREKIARWVENNKIEMKRNKRRKKR